ncbi:hypothetical protein PAXRUDRAFT_829055 [Paxillus rubicundulus Ve08.2h10]|uniref:DUF155 domain-containing protein n=1 Tax=Paxillus rubicundulus Ve08.2h10 TaxID=930991 RepID=A0A0D0DVA7_9AGAM|nr:hypothetical protein PAXRUDRAFT_829055 [Paxillus rubicundulus Ve08.2h10]
MSFITQPTLPTTRPAYRRPVHPPRTLASHPRAQAARRPSASLTAATSHPKPKPTVAVVPTGKPLRTSKTTERLVLLPSTPQTKPLVPPSGITYPGAPEDDVLLGYETDAGPVREYKSAAERMSKEQREKAGYNRITAYCVAEGIKMKLLAGFLKREHNVHPRVFDEAMYVMYHLPLLPGYSPSTTIRSSAAPTKAHLTRLSEAEENGYQGSYFSTPRQHSHEEAPRREDDGYMTEGRADGYVAEGREGGYISEVGAGEGYVTEESPVQTRMIELPGIFTGESETEGGETEVEVGIVTEAARETEAEVEQNGWGGPREDRKVKQTLALHSGFRPLTLQAPEPELEEPIAEVVFFEYGVVVFYGFDVAQERCVIDDLANAGILKRMIKEDDWEIEECHFAIDLSIPHPRIYNDFFTFKSPSHLLKLSVSHALAQSTLLATYETTASRVLSDPLTLSIPRQLVQSGALSLKRRDALRLTGRLFKLRRDVNLVSNVLDVPELFWTEASLGGLYESVREYMEVEERVGALNEKLGVASDFLDVIHDHLNNSAMERITWIVIWLIILVIFVEVGEVFARLAVHGPVAADGTAGVRGGLMRGLVPHGGLVKMLAKVLDAKRIC